MSKELDIVPVLSRQLTSSTHTREATSKLDGKEIVDDEKGLDESVSIKESSQDFPWKWKATALALGVFLSGKLWLLCLAFCLVARM